MRASSASASPAAPHQAGAPCGRRRIASVARAAAGSSSQRQMWASASASTAPAVEELDRHRRARGQIDGLEDLAHPAGAGAALAAEASGDELSGFHRAQLWAAAPRAQMTWNLELAQPELATRASAPTRP